MLNTIFATKVEMSQAWSEDGKRLPITKLKVSDNIILSKKETQDKQITLEIGYGQKKLKNVTKPLRAKIAKSGFSFGVKQVEGVKLATQEEGETVIEAGQTLALNDVLAIGDVVEIQGSTKGRGFAGAIKRYGFHGGPKTHGQSDRWRGPGSRGATTTPGRVFKGSRGPGHMGDDSVTAQNLKVVLVDAERNVIGVNGSVPGARGSLVVIKESRKM